MARPCKIPTDPDVYNKMIENLALGMPQVLIANSIGVSDSALSDWKKRPGFRMDLAVRTREILKAPMEALAKSNPGLFLATHPATRESHAPPTQKQETAVTGEIRFRLVNDDLYRKTEGE